MKQTRKQSNKIEKTKKQREKKNKRQREKYPKIGNRKSITEKADGDWQTNYEMTNIFIETIGTKEWKDQKVYGWVEPYKHSAMHSRVCWNVANSFQEQYVL